MGDLVEDVIIAPHDASVMAGSDNPSRITRRRGGSAANTAAAAGRHGPTRFIGRVGSDRLGDALVADLTAERVDVRVQRGGRTGTVVALLDERGERTMFADRGASADLERIDPQWIAGTEVLHAAAYLLATEKGRDVLEDAIATARTFGARVTIDVAATTLIEAFGVDEFRRWIERIRPDIVFANEDEAAVLGLADIDPPRGCAWIIKHGPDPAVIAIGSDRYHQQARNIGPVSDTTGAGDAFAAGFLVSYREGADEVAATANGHRIAAEVLAGRSTLPR